MKITYDPAKRDWTLRERGLDFEQAAQVFAGPTIDIPDLRRDYGERRINSVGYLNGRMVILTNAAEPVVRRVLERVPDLDGLEVVGADLEEAFVALTRAGAPA